MLPDIMRSMNTRATSRPPPSPTSLTHHAGWGCTLPCLDGGCEWVVGRRGGLLGCGRIGEEEGVGHELGVVAKT